MDLLNIGVVLRPKGLNGEVKIDITTNKGEIFIGLQYAFLDGKRIGIKKSSINNGFAYLIFEGFESVSLAEKLRNKIVAVEKDKFLLGTDEVLAEDLIGFKVIDENGKVFGCVKAIENYGAGDFFECVYDINVASGYFSFPNEDAFIIETNMTEKKIVVRNDVLEEVIVL
jgi:16S rRNA processing protein RimM